MKTTDLRTRLAAMKDSIRRIEDEVAAGTIDADAVEDFKGAVDEARTRIWAVLSAANSADPQAFMQRFRLRRAIDICRTVVKDVADGHLRAGSAELAELRRVARQLAEQTPLK